jgi:hypothetical protein
MENSLVRTLITYNFQQAQSRTTDSTWGVVDMATPDTDFPDVRNKALVHSNHGSVIFVPREQDRIRIYIQLEDKDFINPVTGRLDKNKIGPEQILEVSGIHQMTNSHQYPP